MSRRKKEVKPEPSELDMLDGIMLHVYLLHKFGPRLDMTQVASVLRITVGTIYERITDSKFGLRTYMDGRSRYADYRDVADYIQECREAARDAARDVVEE